MAISYLRATNTGKGFITHEDQAALVFTGYGDLWKVEGLQVDIDAWGVRVGATVVDDVTAQAEIDAMLAAAEADMQAELDAMRRKVLSRFEFRSQFTAAEKQAIYTAAETVIDVRIWLDDLASAEQVDLENQATIDGLNTLEASGLIGVGRAAEILKGVL